MIPQVQPASPDQAARELIRTSLEESLFVEASAGTGKTTELVRRIVAVLKAGAAVDRIVAVTFTHKAAGELKLRLRQGLDEGRAEATGREERAHLEHALEHLEEASIGTIHSFCAQILRQRPVEARVDPSFGETTEYEAGRIFSGVFRQWFARHLELGSPGLRRALLLITAGGDADAVSPTEELERAAWNLIEWRDFPAAWRRPDYDRSAAIDELLGRVKEVAQLSARSTNLRDPLRKSLEAVREFAEQAERASRLRGRDEDELESLLIRLAADLAREKFTGRGRLYATDLPREQVVEARASLLAALQEFARQAGADLAAVLRDELWELVAAYDEAKKRAGRLDFLDLLIHARDLVRCNREVREYLQQRYTHLFIDEFQDTDPLQAELLLLLAADSPDETNWLAARPRPGKLFVVGDPKQSIYKFRRADVVLYQRIQRALEERGVRVVRLSRSFRAVRPIQECVNAAFAAEMQGDQRAGQASYTPLEEHWPAPESQPAVIALPVPRPYAKVQVAKSAINGSLPGAIVGFIEWLLKASGWTVRDPEDASRRVPVNASHIAVLFRRFINWGDDLTRHYMRGLEARGIPHLVVGSKSFHKREEVETLRAALAAIEWPDDELSVFATLKGPLFAIPDATLLRFRHEHGPIRPFRKLREDVSPALAPVAEALRTLEELHRGRNWRPVAETVNLLLEATRAWATFALRPAGQQVLANVHRVADLARNYEMGGGTSFRGFVEDLELQAERALSAEAPVLEDTAEGVRLMTVHSAKGLEFPVVILADISANIAQRNPERFVDPARGLCATRLLRCAPLELLESEPLELERERAEGVRVAYVAATRARDLLVVPAVGDEEVDGWVSPLNKAIYPPRARFRHATLAANCPAFGGATVLERPRDLTGGPEESVYPGSHRPREGAHEVVWWDPALIETDTEGSFGLRHQELLAEVKEEGEEPVSLLRYREWKQERAWMLAEGGKPSHQPFAASQPDVEAPAWECPVELAHLERDPGRPAGRRFGSLVHAVLAAVPLEAARDDALRQARLWGRVLGAPEDEVEAAVNVVVTALRHPLLERARLSGEARREWPVLLRLEEGRLLDGVLDLAFVEDGVWQVVDFKTDAHHPGRFEHYRRQVLWYCFAMHRLRDAPVRGWILAL